MASVNPETTPAGQAPPGQRSNLVDPYSLQPYIIATCVTCLTFSLLAISVRTFVKVHIIKKVQWEDYALIFSGAIFVVYCSIILAGGNTGLRHVWDLSIERLQRHASIENVLEMLYCLILFTAKLCVLLQMMRLFKGNKKDSVYWIIQALIWTNAVFYGSLFFCFLFACRPRAKLQNPKIPGVCINGSASILATSAINIVSDFSIILLPVYAVWKLKITVKRKLAIAAVFGSGLFACISSVVRLVYTVRLTLTSDVTYVASIMAMWTIAEFTTVILASAFPTMPRFLQWIRAKKHPASHFRSHHKSPRLLHDVTGTRYDMEAGASSWNGPNSTTVIFTDNYVRLEEQNRANRSNSGLNFQGDTESAEPTSLTYPSDARCQDDKGVRKTVRMETSYSANDNFHPPPPRIM